MQITISGKGIDVGASLREHVEKRVNDIISKYLDRINNVMVVVTREAHLFRIDINANTGTHAGIVIKSRAEAPDVYACFDLAMGKIEKQLRRYKRRITNHHKAKLSDAVKAMPPVRATKYVLASPEEEPEKDDLGGMVIAEKTTDIETLTVGEAVMKMDLSDLPALMFFNSANGRLNVVYRRADGNISWVDPEERTSSAA